MSAMITRLLRWLDAVAERFDGERIVHADLLGPDPTPLDQAQDQALAIVANPEQDQILPCVDPDCLICASDRSTPDTLLRAVEAESARLRLIHGGAS